MSTEINYYDNYYSDLFEGCRFQFGDRVVVFNTASDMDDVCIGTIEGVSAKWTSVSFMIVRLDDKYHQAKSIVMIDNCLKRV